ncbi:hypothetical protein FACS189487_10150 [Campylobacterota bacterium]|nr:hypothetical protein FACS189487_10150 [Campylobacterota bacterium]
MSSKEKAQQGLLLIQKQFLKLLASTNQQGIGNVNQAKLRYEKQGKNKLYFLLQPLVFVYRP